MAYMRFLAVADLIVVCQPNQVDSADGGIYTVTISGNLLCDNVGLDGKQIILSYNSGGDEGFTPITSEITTTEAGQFTYDWQLSSGLQNGFYVIYAQFQGDGPYLSSYGYADGENGLMIPTGICSRSPSSNCCMFCSFPCSKKTENWIAQIAVELIFSISRFNLRLERNDTMHI
jgi:hypothetical protein